MNGKNVSENECCPRFDPQPWDNKVFDWDNKLFIRGKVKTFFFMPLNFGSVIRRLMKKIEESGASLADSLCLSDHTSKWNMDIYLAVDREVPEAENRKLSGKYLSRVYEGKFSKTGEWCKDFESQALEAGWKIKKWYMWYTTCPKCAKKYGKNYVAIISEIEPK